jgi:Glycosyltransferases involved in cell wall biogenesis
MMESNELNPTEKPLISVMMACYNAELYIEQAIESILNQTYKNFELIIVDDGSTDNSTEIIKNLAKNDRRVKLYYNKENKGQVYTRNRMLKIALGEYLAVMDADDVSCPERLEKQVEFLLNHPDIDGVSSGGWKIDHNGKQIGKIDLPGRTSNEVRAWFFFDDIIIHSSAMFKKKIVNKCKLFYKEGYFVMQDYAFFAQYLCVGNWIVMKEHLIEYRVLTTSISHNMDQKKKEIVRRLESEIRMRYLNDWGISLDNRSSDIILDSVSKFREKRNLYGKLKLMIPYFKIVIKAKNVPFYREFIVCAVKMLKLA